MQRVKQNGYPFTYPGSLSSESVDIADITGWEFNALRDPQGNVLRDPDGMAIYDPTSVIDNPPVPPINGLNTLEDLLALPSRTFNRANIRNFYDTDGRQSEWQFLADPTVTTETLNRYAMTDGNGYVFRVSILN